jgi:hypothetical protein
MHAGAEAVRGQHLALEIGHRLDAGLLLHHVVSGKIVLAAVLDLVGDDAQIREARVLHGKRKAREPERSDLQLSHGQRSDLRRRGAEIDRFEQVGFALVPGEPLLGEQHRDERGRRHHPAGTNLDGLRVGVSDEDGRHCGRDYDFHSPVHDRPRLSAAISGGRAGRRIRFPPPRRLWLPTRRIHFEQLCLLHACERSKSILGKKIAPGSSSAH